MNKYPKLPRVWIFESVKRFDLSDISSYAFNRSTISRYLEKAKFEDHKISNDRSPAVFATIKGLGFGKLIRLVALGLATIIELITLRKYLIASSLSEKAIKPSQ